MSKHKHLLIDQFDRKTEAFKSAKTIAIPDKGWINNVRTALNMTLEQLGKKLKMTKQ
ncbi:MAG: XRE family transcriptional regulator, partial [Flavobacteriales bacterium]|nr:XRE family transcriptional regulator [Flavobacteriales bacterium]